MRDRHASRGEGVEGNGMNAEERRAAFLRAEQRVCLAHVAAFELSPHYDSDEAGRQRHLAFYREMAESYGRMAETSEAMS